MAIPGDDIIEKLVDVLSLSTASMTKQHALAVETEGLLRALMQAQQDPGLGPRDMNTLTSWLKDQDDVSFDFEFKCDDDKENFHCVATREIAKKENFLKVPLRIMLTTEDAKYSPTLRCAIEDVAALQRIPLLSLSMFVIDESLKKDSQYAPYIKSLPRKYTLPLWYTAAELDMVIGTTVQHELLRVYKVACQNYILLYKELPWAKLKQAGSALTKETFTFARFRWAFSAVTSRQNFVPKAVIDARRAAEAAKPNPVVTATLEEGVVPSTGTALEESCLALIPVWDMMNHTNGPLSTFFETETNVIECEALDGVAKGKEVKMFYGPRSGIDLMLHCGFWQERNPYDVFMLPMNISSNAKNAELKQRLLTMFGLGASNLRIAVGAHKPIEERMVVHQRIAVMNEETLLYYLKGPREQLERLTDMNYYPKVQDERTVTKHLMLKLQLMIKQYASGQDQDLAHIHAKDVQGIERDWIYLRQTERMHINECLKALNERLKSLTQPSFGSAQAGQSDPEPKSPVEA